MSRGMPRRRCLEYAILLGLVQIVITFGVVWFLRTSKATPTDPTDKRLLLSLDYSNRNNYNHGNRDFGMSSSTSSSSSYETGRGRSWSSSTSSSSSSRTRDGKRIPVLDTSNFMDAEAAPPRSLAFKSTTSEGSSSLELSSHSFL